MGYPSMTARKDVNRSLRIWLRTIAIDDADVIALADELKDAVRNADILGVPRQKQMDFVHPLWRAVRDELEAFELVRPDTLLTHTALHRLLQHALLYRPLLEDRDFLGVISCRRLMDEMQAVFGVDEVRWYGVRGELEDTGEIDTPHFPDGFEELRNTLEVPHQGAVFLVGAGVFGKVYCEWIKERGGIAIDVGSIFDAWANIGRVGEPVRSLEVYREFPRVGRLTAAHRYNALADELELDVPKADVDAAYFGELPAFW